jgi:hypothetical protein
MAFPMVMALWRKFILNLEKLRRGFYPKSTYNYSTSSQVDFAQHFGVGKNKRILYALIELVGRPSKQVQVLLSIHLLFLPAYSPQLQRA